jgi:hypothetical protein
MSVLVVVAVERVVLVVAVRAVAAVVMLAVQELLCCHHKATLVELLHRFQRIALEAVAVGLVLLVAIQPETYLAEMAVLV